MFWRSRPRLIPAIKELKFVMPANRSFGLTFAAILLAAGLWPLLHHHPVRWWTLGVSAAFLLAALVCPRALQPLNLLWYRLGLLLHKVVSPLIMGLMFFLVVAPIGLLKRLTGGDPLARQFRPDQESYWEGRKNGRTDMRRQY